MQIEQRSYFKWQRAKAWKRCQAWFWMIDCNQSLQPNWLQMKCTVWKPCSDQRNLTGQALIFYLKIFEQSAFVTFIYCVNDQPFITRPRRSVLNFKLSVLTFSRSMSCLMSTEQKLCEMKIFQLQSMQNAIKCINERFAFKNSRILCLALIFNLKNPSTTVL